jgi:hypothetical protein
MLLIAKGRGFSPKYVLFDGWYASLENLKQVRGHGWHWLTRLKGNRQVTPEDRVGRSLDEVAFGDSGKVVHLRGYGLVLVFRIDAPDGVAEYWATGDLTMDAGVRRQHAELGFAIENYHRELKQNCGVERSQAGPSARSGTTSGWRCGRSCGWSGTSSPPGSAGSRRVARSLIQTRRVSSYLPKSAWNRPCDTKRIDCVLLLVLWYSVSVLRSLSAVRVWTLSVDSHLWSTRLLVSAPGALSPSYEGACERCSTADGVENA